MAIGVDKKTKYYEGEMKYKPIFDFCNIYQETFFVVGKDTTGVEGPKKPWLEDKFPELTKESANDICFKVDGSICVFIVNKEKPSQNLEQMMLNIQAWLSPKINRGAKYKFGWINSSTQVDIITEMKLQKEAGPALVLINHGSRKRYHVFEGELKEEEIKKIFEKLAGGDVRFTAFKGNKLPELNE